MAKDGRVGRYEGGRVEGWVVGRTTGSLPKSSAMDMSESVEGEVWRLKDGGLIVRGGEVGAGSSERHCIRCE